MHGPRLIGTNGTELRPPTQEDAKQSTHWMLEPGPSRFWGGRAADLREERIKERFQEGAKSEDQILWSIAYQGETVGFTGLFDIDWIARDAESGVFIGRSDLYGRGIGSEAVRLRTDFAWSELRLHRIHNWIALGNRGSRRANQKAGYRQIGLMENVWFRSGEWHHGWLGEVFPPGEGSAPAMDAALDRAGTISPPRIKE